MSRASSRPAVFLDRDGTLIEDAHYLADASRVVLLPGVAAAVRRVNEAGIPVFIVTNQSGIGRGLITPAQYEAVRARTERLLHDAGASIHTSYHCPHVPGPSPCRCRKPGTAMYEQAAIEHGVTLAGSAYIGDRWRDVAPAIALQGIGVLVPGAETPAEDADRVRTTGHPAVLLAPSLEEAIRLALDHMGHVGAD